MLLRLPLARVTPGIKRPWHAPGCEGARGRPGSTGAFKIPKPHRLAPPGPSPPVREGVMGRDGRSRTPFRERSEGLRKARGIRAEPRSNPGVQEAEWTGARFPKYPLWKPGCLGRWQVGAMRGGVAFGAKARNIRLSAWCVRVVHACPNAPQNAPPGAKPGDARHGWVSRPIRRFRGGDGLGDREARSSRGAGFGVERSSAECTTDCAIFGNGNWCIPGKAAAGFGGRQNGWGTGESGAGSLPRSVT